MVCKQCGKRIKGDPTRCPHCDAVLKETVSLGSIHAAQTQKKKAKKKLSGTDLALRIALISVSVLAALAILLGVGYLYVKNLIRDNANIDNKFSQSEIDDMGVNTALPTKDIQNIALFGLDERGDTDAVVDGLGAGKSFHSDAIIILTVDRRDPDNPRVKLSSIARDTLAYVEGYNSKGSLTKLTHAFDYGYRKAKSADRADGKKDQTEADYKREGAKTAIKTINQNFNMNITEYMYVNFVEFMDIIDYVGGVTINVKQKELNELNKHVYWMEKECDRDIDKVTKAGEQTLSGGQALAYARVRKVDSDLVRANRQRDVLKAVFDKVKSTPINKLPDVVGKLLGMCHTTLTAEEIVEMGTWAVTKGPEIINYTLPDTSVKANWIWEGTHPNYGWVWIYDLNYATYLLHDFIYDTDTAKDQPKPTMPNEPKVTAGKNTTTTTTEPTQPPVTGVMPTGPATEPSGDPTGWTDPSWTDPTWTYPTQTDPTDVVDPTGDPTEGTDPTATGVIGTTGTTTETQPTESTTVPSFDTPETTTTTEFVVP
ncbi:MAG: LCP family protein [Clostridia bacterium]|nr:LCP family protein [Clostridia bacterium]